jgi:hypothetical protein
MDSSLPRPLFASVFQPSLPWGNQRWRARRDSYRPPEEPIRTAEYDVAPIAADGPAKRFVEEHHYSASYPAARFRFGLYRQGGLVGVTVYSHPCNAAVLTSVFPGSPDDSVELGRFVLLDEVPGNGETWFLARTFGLLRSEGLRGVVGFSDPSPRTDLAGNVVFPGHLGRIYQAANAVYLGRGTPRILRLLPDGTVLSERALQKIRKRERGWRYAVDLLTRFGAAPPRSEEDLVSWLRLWLPRLTRPLRHHGTHKYAWSLRRGRRFALPGRPFPKLLDKPRT